MKAFNANPSSPPPPTDFKPLPNHLKYIYLDEDKLLQVLRQHKKEIGWKLSDLPGINPSICMHRILMEEAVDKRNVDSILDRRDGVRLTRSQTLEKQ
ncbi:hypothetical protein CR513_61748, partial [Mucuna pruriens]